MIPAHNEAHQIARCLRAIRPQVDHMLVVADNCTDGTERIALAHGAAVLPTQGNQHKKAGAMNQALSVLLPDLRAIDYVLIVDADSTITPDFVAAALRTFDRHDTCGAVGGLFRGDPAPRGLLAELQRNEYARYTRDIARRRGRAWVLTGTATMWNVTTLRNIARARGSWLPGRKGDVYNLDALTEDNEITLAAKTLGYACLSPSPCVVTTELMPTWRDLWRQRLRWERGALENLRDFGRRTPIVLPYWLQQSGLMLGAVAMWLYLLLTGLAVGLGVMGWSWFWAGIGAVFVVERVVTVWSRGPAARLLALCLLPEMVYDLFQQAVLVAAIWKALRRSEATWHHAGPTREPAAA